MHKALLDLGEHVTCYASVGRDTDRCLVLSVRTLTKRNGTLVLRERVLDYCRVVLTRRLTTNSMDVFSFRGMKHGDFEFAFLKDPTVVDVVESEMTASLNAIVRMILS